MTFDEFAASWRSGAPCIEAHTSGSTGAPKAIALPRKFVEESARRTNEFFGIRGDSLLYCPLAADYIAGKMMWVRAELAGAEFEAEEASNRPLSRWTHGRRRRIDLLAVVPSQLQYLINTDAGALPQIGDIIVGGAPTDDDTRLRAAEWCARTGTRVFETYGMTETASHIALREISTRPAPYFHTLPGISVSCNAEGCLTIDIPGWPQVETRDCARIVSPTEFAILGRADGVIITGGLKVHPEDVERRIARIVGRPAMVSSEPHPKWGEQVVLVVETAGEPMSDRAKEELLQALAGVLAPHERPRRIRCTDALPRTRTGKIARKTGK